MAHFSFDLVHTILEHLHAQSSDVEAKQALKRARLVNNLWDDVAARLVFREIDVTNSLKRAQRGHASFNLPAQSEGRDHTVSLVNNTETMAKYVRRVRANIMAWNTDLNAFATTAATIRLLFICNALQHVHLRGIPIFVRCDPHASDARAALCQLNNLRSLEIEGRDSYSEDAKWEADMSLVDVLSLVVHWPRIESLELPSLLSVSSMDLDSVSAGSPILPTRTLKNLAVGFHPSCSAGDIHLLASRLAAGSSLTRLSLRFGGFGSSTSGGLTGAAADALKNYFSDNFEEDQGYDHDYGVGPGCQWAESLRDLALSFATPALSPTSQRGHPLDIGLEHLHNLQTLCIIVPSPSSSFLPPTSNFDYPISLSNIDTLPSLIRLSLTAPFDLHFSFAENLLQTVTQTSSEHQHPGGVGYSDGGNEGPQPGYEPLHRSLSRIAYPNLQAMTLIFNDRFPFADLLALRGILDQIRATCVSAAAGGRLDAPLFEINGGPAFPMLLKGLVRIQAETRRSRLRGREIEAADAEAYNDSDTDGDTGAEFSSRSFCARSLPRRSRVQLDLNEVYREWSVFAPILTN